MADETPEGQQGPPKQRPGGEGPSEEELRARVEAELRKLRVQDLLLETAVSVLNLSARRIAKEDERDLEQARVGIDAVRALVGLLDSEPAAEVRSALSEVQMLYARAAGGAGPGGEGGAGGTREGAEAPPGQERPPVRERPRPGLWTPPGSVS